MKDQLSLAGIEAELVTFTTTGDKFLDDPLHKIGDKGLFTSRLHQALLESDCDIAVHSTKDIPTELEPGVKLMGVLKREDPRDVLLAQSHEVDLDNQNANYVIGTSSLRRIAFLRHYAPQFQVKNIRGNIHSRIEKMMKGEYDGIVLAYAGVKRMGFTDLVVRKMNVHTFTPAVGQGAVGVTANEAHPQWDAIREAINHQETELAITAERSYLKKMEGGCHIPLYALATVVGESLTLIGGIASEDGQEVYRDTVEGPADSGAALGELLATRILDSGATKIINAYTQRS